MSKLVEIRDGKKPCSVCLKWLDLERFTPARLGPGGRQSTCKTCYNERRRNQRSTAPIKSARLAARAGPLAARRSCLQCGRMFESSGPGNRICPRHENVDGYWPAVYGSPIHATN